MNTLYFPFIIQAVLMGIDEHLHKKRGLGVWERLGHPLDTLTVILPVSFVAMNPISDNGLMIFVGLAAFSCLFITKDEFVHTRECHAFENWLHSVLFVMHPILFLCTALIWKFHPEDDFLKILPFLVSLFMMYQILRWSIPWKRLSK